ncbi:MAG TPA: radical SAM protein, partial [Patescibacteria group bacterium]|nr:radical SAM protein [Patescibacteria group bacterium]
MYMVTLKDYEEKIEKLVLKLKNDKKPIVLFGTAHMGLVAKKTLEFLGSNPTYFCDNNKTIQGTTVESLLVISPQQIAEEHPDANIFICSFNKRARSQLKKQLSSLGLSNIHSIDILLYVYFIKLVKRNVRAEDFLDTIHKVFNEGESDEELVINLMGLVITQRCSLKCRDCGSLMQYYQSPYHYDIDMIIMQIKRLSEAADVIGRVDIVGGEPFLHPNLVEICKEISRIPNILMAQVVTNGTILPSEETIRELGECGILVTISDYEELSTKKLEIIKACEKNGVCIWTDVKPSGWTDMGSLDSCNRTMDENIKIYQNCTARIDCNSLQNGEYHLCPRSSHAAVLGAVPKIEGEYVNILD